MRNRVKALVSWFGAAVLWFGDRLYGDAIFNWVRPMIPVALLNPSLDTAIWWVVSLGPPIALIALGVYFFRRDKGGNPNLFYSPTVTQSPPSFEKSEVDFSHWNGATSTLLARAKAVANTAVGRIRYVNDVLESTDGRLAEKWLKKADLQRIDFARVESSGDTALLTDRQKTAFEESILKHAELERCVTNIVAGKNYESPKHAAGLYSQRARKFLTALQTLIAELEPSLARDADLHKLLEEARELVERCARESPDDDDFFRWELQASNVFLRLHRHLSDDFKKLLLQGRTIIVTPESSLHSGLALHFIDELDRLERDGAR